MLQGGSYIYHSSCYNTSFAKWRVERRNYGHLIRKPPCMHNSLRTFHCCMVNKIIGFKVLQLFLYNSLKCSSVKLFYVYTCNYPRVGKSVLYSRSSYRGRQIFQNFMIICCNLFPFPDFYLFIYLL